jgi:predicted nucleic acid-binding protein
VDVNVARAYGRIVGAVVSAKRKHRGTRSLDLMIAATALANQIPLYTRNPDDFVGLESLIDVRAI